MMLFDWLANYYPDKIEIGVYPSSAAVGLY